MGTAGTAGEARRLAREHRPDILLIDVQLPGGDGIDAAAELHAARPELRIVILTGHTDLGVLARAAGAGVCGFLPKESGMAEVLWALRTARDGGMVIDGTTLSAVLDRVARREQPAAPAHVSDSGLTDREMEVLRALGARVEGQRRVTTRTAIAPPSAPLSSRISRDTGMRVRQRTQRPRSAR